jgi:hypothetical protein
MNGQDIFESLEYLDNKYLRETQTYLQTKQNRKDIHKLILKKYLATAAVVSLVVIGGIITFVHLSIENSNNKKFVVDFENELEQDTKICLDGKIYQITSLTPVLKLPAGYEYVGVIESNVSSNLIPKDDLEANADIIGSKVYQAGEMIAINADGTEEYWIFQEKNDLVYRTYDTGFDIDCSNGEEVTIYWNYSKSELNKVYLYVAQENKQKEISTEEMLNKNITINQSGHYFLYGIDTDGQTIDLTEYLRMEYKNTTHIDGENDSQSEEPMIGL